MSKLSDIADVKITGKAESISRTNGSESIGIQVTRSPDADTVAIVDEVNEEASNFKEEFNGVSVHYYSIKLNRLKILLKP